MLIKRNEVKKKLVIIASILLLTAAGVVLWWPSSPEYGDSYSEQQRKLWNERRALYPFVWGARLGVLLDEDMISQLTGLEQSDIWLLMEEKEARNNELRREQKRLLETENLPFLPCREGSLDSSSLPANQISVRECQARARGGDADACLMMAFHKGCDRSDVLSWRRARDVDYWLMEAEALKRPGILFLRNLRATRLPKNGKHSYYGTKYSIPFGGKYLDYTKLNGYDEWLKCVQDGDYLVFRLFIRFGDGDRLQNKERALLLEALRRRVQAGDVRAMENMCALFFDFYDGGILSKYVKRDMLNSLKGSVFQLLSEEWHESVTKFCVRIGVVNAKDTAVMREFREVVTCAREAARHGSLYGMTVWLQFGQVILDEFSREDWEEMFRFHRILMERCYVPFVQGCYEGETYPSPYEFYYSSQSMDEALNGALERSGLKEETMLSEKTSMLKGKTAKEVLRQLDEWISILGADFVLQEMLIKPDYWARDVAPEVVAVYVAKVKELAAEGDPMGKLVLGYLFENGLGVPRDLGQAWASYRAADKATGVFGEMSVSYREPPHGEFLESWFMDRAPSLLMLSLGVRYADFPGRDESQIFAMAQDLSRYSFSEGTGYLNYLLGRVYEDGIGTPVDQGKACEYYELSRSCHAGCAERWEKLKQDELDSSGQN